MTHNIVRFYKTMVPFVLTDNGITSDLSYHLYAFCKNASKLSFLTKHKTQPANPPPCTLTAPTSLKVESIDNAFTMG